MFLQAIVDCLLGEHCPWLCLFYVHNKEDLAHFKNEERAL